MRGITSPISYDIPLSIQLKSSPGFDLWVMEDGNKIWSRYRIFAAVVWTFTLDPGESVHHEYEWDMRDYDGNLVAPGDYEIVGVTYGARDVSTTITIVPEPAGITLVCFGAIAILRRRHR